MIGAAVIRLPAAPASSRLDCAPRFDFIEDQPPRNESTHPEDTGDLPDEYFYRRGTRCTDCSRSALLIFHRGICAGASREANLQVREVLWRRTSWNERLLLRLQFVRRNA